MAQKEIIVPMDVDRRQDGQTERTIDDMVRRADKEGIGFVIQYMEMKAIPLSVGLRVLTDPQFRRKKAAL